MRRSALAIRRRSWSRREILRVLATAWLFGLTARARADTLASERREIGPFRAVELDGIGELFITQGERESLTIEAERRLLSRMTANVRDGVLRFHYGQAMIRTRAPIRFMLTVRDLEQLWLRGSGNCHIGALRVRKLESENAGSGDLIIERLEAAELNASVTGAATVEVGGTVHGQRVSISGAGDYRAFGLHCRWAEVVIAGSGNVELSVAEHLAARIDGSGTIRYRGRPTIDQQITGAGTIEPMGGESGGKFN